MRLASVLPDLVDVFQMFCQSGRIGEDFATFIAGELLHAFVAVLVGFVAP